MRKIFLCLIILIFSVQIAMATENITINGKVKSLNIQEKQIVVAVEQNILTKVWKTLKRLVRIDTKKVVNEYQVKVLDTTKIENNNKESLALEKINVGDSISVKGKIITEKTDTTAGVIEAEYIRVFKFKSVTAVIINFFGFNTDSQLSSKSGSGIVAGSPNSYKDTLPTLPKVFEKEECVSEGEPLLVNTLFAPKVNDQCCEDLVECISGSYKSTPVPTGSEVITINGFSYIVKGYCRKECTKEDSNSGSYLLPLLPKIPEVKIYECYTDKDCCPTSIMLCNKVCINNKCVNKSLENIDLGCSSNDDCIYENESCKTRTGTFGLFNLFGSSSSNKCVCNLLTHSCQLAEQKDIDDGCDNNMKCSDETVWVCGKDGKSYTNPCEAVRCNTQVSCAGKCPCKPATSLPLKPGIPGRCDVKSDCELCGNECFESKMLMQLKNEGRVCEDSDENLRCECQDNNCIIVTYEKEKECEDSVKLVCGVDGKNYKNKCEAEKENVEIKCEKACPCEVTNPTLVCPLIYQPVCGLDNKTYSNSCSAHNEGVDIKCNQACPCTTTTTSTTTTTQPKASAPGTGTWKDILINGFCGIQTEASCTSDGDCKVGGCSGTICQGKSEPSAITTCDWQSCYQKPSNIYCGCDGGKCKWYSTLTGGSDATLPVLNPGLGTTPITTPSSPTTVPPKICLMVMSCLNGKVLSADCGETGNKCYDFTETGNGNCYCN